MRSGQKNKTHFLQVMLLIFGVLLPSKGHCLNLEALLKPVYTQYDHNKSSFNNKAPFLNQAGQNEQSKSEQKLGSIGFSQERVRGPWFF